MRNRYHPIILAENCYLPPSKSCLFISSAKTNHFSEISNRRTKFFNHLPSKSPLFHIRATRMWRRRGRSLDNFLAYFRYMSKDGVFVYTSYRRIREFSWNHPQINITLHQKSEIISFIIS